MCEAYNSSLVDMAKKEASELGIEVQEGVYAFAQGPMFETPAEIRALGMLGADAVGMSTTQEVIIARHMGLPCFAVSIITDLGVEGMIEYTTHESVQHEAEKTEASMTLLMTEMIASL
jgi:purine-nucleoside phosphorylase